MTIDMEYYSIYDSYQNKYRHLKEKFIEISSLHVNLAALEALKEFYDNVICSKRDSENIKNLSGLLNMLEKRSVLAYNQIEPLKHIATTVVNDPVLNNAIKVYGEQLDNQQKLPLFNVYKCRSGEYSKRQKHENSSSDFIEIKNSLLKASFDNLKNRHSRSSSSSSSLEESCVVEQQNIKTCPLTYSIINSEYNFDNSNDVKRFDSARIFDVTNNIHFLNGGCGDKRCKYLISTVIGSISMLVMIIMVIFIFIATHLKSPVMEASSNATILSPVAARSNNNSQLLPSTSTVLNSHDASRPPQLSGQSFGKQENATNDSELQFKGRSWRDLGRFLGLKESEIDAIDHKSPYDTKEKAIETLEIFKTTCNPCNWKKKLLQSLERVRRKDLAEEVADIITEYERK